jgi:hypothetical protein
MNNPIETNAFRHFLEVNGTRTEILEPIGFDASNFVVEQKKDGYARDIFYGNSEASLEFHYEYGINDLPTGLELILEQENITGAESDVNYILQKNGVDFTIGQLDFASAETDYKSYFKCSVIQNNDRSIIKKREKIKVDLFAKEDLDKNVIEPINTSRLLLRAKPVNKVSDWSSKEVLNLSQIGNAFNCQVSIPISNNLVNYGIDSTLAPFDVFFKGLDVSQTQNNNYRFANRLITAKNSLSNIKLKIKGLTVNGTTNLGIFSLNISRAKFTNDGDWIENVGTTIQPIISTGSISITNQNFEIDIPDMSIGESLIISMDCFYASSILRSFNMRFNRFSCESVEILATETGIDSVIEVVRYIDLIKQTYKTTAGFVVNAPKYDIGGQFYDNFCFSGKLIRQIKNEPFYSTISDVNESLIELNADAELTGNKTVSIGQYSDFYSNVKMGSYPMLPEASAKFTKNERYLINKFSFGYDKFEQDREEDNTIDAIHTDSEWFVPNDNSINEKSVKVNYIRDAYFIESVRRRSTEKKTTSNNSDDDIFIVDGIELAPGQTNTITGVFTVQISNSQNTFKILANDNFRWDLLGFQVGNTMTVSYNNITYNLQVSAIESAIVTLAWPNPITFNGETYLSVTYPLTGVDLVIRTNEELDFTENIINSDNYANLRYSIKRNMSYWFPYLATVGKFIPTKEITNSYFKSNGNAIIKFSYESESIKENASILISELSNLKILSQNIFETTIVIEFEDMVNLMGKIQTERGYIEVDDHSGNIVKGYIVDLSHTWATNECKITLEVKND